MKKIRFVKVTWVDSVGAGGWHTVPDGEFEKFMSQSLVCRSVGYLVYRKKDRIGLAQSTGVGGTNWSNLMVIPRCAIQKIENLP